MGEALCAALLFPERQRHLIKFIERKVQNAESLFRRFKRVLLNLYKATDWSIYSLVGFTVNFQQLFASLLLAQWLKRDYPQILIALGGVITSGDVGKWVLKNFPQIDWCISGEGEITLVELLKCVQTKKRGFEPKVPGLMYRSDTKIELNSKKQLKDLHGLPDPDFDDYFNFKKTDPVLSKVEIPTCLPIEISRGCPYRCTFCCDHQSFQGYRERPADEAAASIRRLSNKYQVPSIFLLAQTIMPKCCENLFPKLASHKSDYRIFCEMRADLTKEHMKLMKAAGITRVQIGIEALHTPLLKKMHKGTRLIDNLKIMKYCEELGIEACSYFLIGFPTETESDIESNVRSIDYAIPYMPPMRFVNFMLFEGSPVYNAPHAYGLCSINDASGFGKLLPKNISAEIKLWYKDYKSQHKPRNYKSLIKRYNEWKELYHDAREIGRPLLCYYDHNHFLCIEDYRKGVQFITLDGWTRELYVYCDNIRRKEEIEERFSDVDKNKLRRTLGTLCEHKVMFCEDDDFLSLAMKMSPDVRRHLPML